MQIEKSDIDIQKYEVEVKKSAGNV